MVLVKLFPLREGQLLKEVILNTKEGDMVSASYETRYNSSLKWYELRFFVPFSEQRGLWTAVGYDTWDDGRRIDRFCLHHSGCYTSWEYAGKSLKDLDLITAFFFYK